jgi:flagellum-specific ATP synthase
VPACYTPEEAELVERARRHMATFENMAELIRLGAYRAGSDPEVDEAIRYNGPLEAFLKQDKSERAELAGGYTDLGRLLGKPAAGAGR